MEITIGYFTVPLFLLSCSLSLIFACGAFAATQLDDMKKVVYLGFKAIYFLLFCILLAVTKLVKFP